MNTCISSVLFSSHLKYISFSAFKVETTSSHPLSPFTLSPLIGESLALRLANMFGQNLSFQYYVFKKKKMPKVILLNFTTVLVHLLKFLYSFTVYKSEILDATQRNM